MFVVTEADAAAIRDAFDQGELSAATELRRRFPVSPTTPALGRGRSHHRRVGQPIVALATPARKLQCPEGSATWLTRSRSFKRRD